MSETNDSQHIVQEHPNTNNIQFGTVQFDPHHHNIHVEPQQPGAVQLRPHHQIIHVQDRIGDIADWDRKISQTEGAYSKINNKQYMYLCLKRSEVKEVKLQDCNRLE
jgi:hypothetical protein